MKIAFIVISCLYGILMIISSLAKGNFKLCKLMFILGGLLLMLSNIGLYYDNVMLIAVLILGILLINIGAIINGYKLYGKPHLKHHIVRFVFSIILILIYSLNFII